MPPKLNTHFLTQDHSTVTKYSDVLKKERNIHSAPPGSLLKGTVHNVNSKNSRPSSHKTRTNSFNATSELFSTSPVPASEPAVDIDKLVKLVENTFPPWSSEYLPELPREENDLPSLNQHRLRQSEESKKYKQWTDEKKRHVVFLKNITHCVKLPTTMPQKSLRSNPKYLHVQSKLLQKKTTSVVPETTSSLNYTNLNFWMSNPSEKEKKKKSSMSMSKPSSSITKSTSLSHAILPSDAGQSLLKLNLDLNVSIHRIETRTEEFMAPEGLPLKSIQRVMDLYKQYRPEITEFETFNLRLLISILKKLPHQRTKIEIAKALPEVMKIKDFQKFSSFFASELLSVMYLEELNEGTCIFKQGDEGTAWYAILFGAVQIFVSTTGDLSGMKPVRILTAGSGFGEVALMSNKPRMATVMTISHTILARVEKEHYSRTMKIAYDQELSVKINFLSRIPCFEGLGDVLIRSIGEVAHWKECKDGEVLFREGDEVDSIYFIKSGKVQCYRRLKQKMVLVAELEANKYFNECYEVTKEGKGYRAKITVKAKGMVKLACITIQDSKTKFSFELPVSPIYHYSEKMLEKIMQQISEKGEWEKQKRKEMDRMAREKLKNPCANWDEFVIRKAQSAKRISEKNFKK